VREKKGIPMKRISKKEGLGRLFLTVAGITFVLMGLLFNSTTALGKESYKDYVKRGTDYYNKGQYGQAIADLTKAIELDPQSIEAYYRRGLAYFKKGQYDEAIADITKVIELDPTQGSAYYLRGTAYLMKGQYEQAIADANKAIESDPLAYLLKALAYEKMNRNNEAIEAYRGFITHALPQDASLVEQAKERIAELEKQR
jgi:tetratricopeptide (TPR) repeat protein